MVPDGARTPVAIRGSAPYNVQYLPPVLRHDEIREDGQADPSESIEIRVVNLNCSDVSRVAVEPSVTLV